MNLLHKRDEITQQLSDTEQLVQRASVALQQAQIQVISLRAQLKLLDDLEQAEKVEYEGCKNHAVS